MSEAYPNDSYPCQGLEAEYNSYTEEQFIIYRIVYPLIIVIGVVNSSICIAILQKPKMQLVLANRYFLVLAVIDLAVCVMSIPVATSINGCSINSYGEAIYYGYFCWSFLEILQPLGSYILLFLSFDRFLAVWNFQYYRNHDKNKVFWRRVVIVLVADIVLHIFFFVNVNISCADGHPKPRYVIEDAVRLNKEKTWHVIFVYFHETLVRWLPWVALAVFNIGLIIAIARGKLSNPDLSSSNDGKMEFNLTVTLILIICSTVSFTFPEAVYMTNFADLHQNECYGDHELFRGIANILQLLEHVFTIVFLALLNPNFREELRKGTRMAFPCKENQESQMSMGINAIPH
ncbi:probable G-protein coupled receptor B0563.6 [Macrobrachium rosenbergii]|uniref:probable G-protein coupled receptor B0563.6 n=1 Tax=Macrobrachium rosenbergii TaxID=79674 RepID=UPI0034D44F29